MSTSILASFFIVFVPQEILHIHSILFCVTIVCLDKFSSRHHELLCTILSCLATVFEQLESQTIVVFIQYFFKQEKNVFVMRYWAKDNDRNSCLQKANPFTREKNYLTVRFLIIAIDYLLKVSVSFVISENWLTIWK